MAAFASALFGDFSGSTWVLLASSWLLAGLLIWIGARVAGLKYVTFGRAILAAFAASGIAWLCMTLFSDVPIAGISLGVLLGLLLSWFAIKEVLNTSPGPALLVWAFDVVAQIVAGMLGISGIGVQLLHLFR
jgi:signal transduction histidine kinase